jgi:hypothetical protein
VGSLPGSWFFSGSKRQHDGRMAADRCVRRGSAPTFSAISAARVPDRDEQWWALRRSTGQPGLHPRHLWAIVHKCWAISAYGRKSWHLKIHAAYERLFRPFPCHITPSRPCVDRLLDFSVFSVCVNRSWLCAGSANHVWRQSENAILPLLALDRDGYTAFSRDAGNSLQEASRPNSRRF